MKTYVLRLLSYQRVTVPGTLPSNRWVLYSRPVQVVTSAVLELYYLGLRCLAPSELQRCIFL